MPSLGPAEILVVLVIALLVFGPNKMPEIARQVGKGFREFKRVQQHLKSELRDVVSEFDSPSSDDVAQPDPVPMLPPKVDDTPAAPAVPIEVAEAPTPPPASPEAGPPVLDVPPTSTLPSVELHAEPDAAPPTAPTTPRDSA